MQKSALTLVCLLFVAAALFSAVMFTQNLAQRYGGLGLVIAQIVFATSAVVLLDRMLWLRLLALGGILLLATAWICASSSLSPLHVGTPLVAVVFVAAAWCGMLRFFGWRVEGVSSRHPCSQSTNAGQFSLGTLLLVMIAVALFLSLLGWSNSTWENGRLQFLLWACLLTIPGCALVLSTSRWRWCWTFTVFPLPLVLVAVYFVDGLTPNTVSFAIAAVCEWIFIFGVIVVLRVAGIFLVRTKHVPLNRPFNSSSAPQLLP